VNFLAHLHLSDGTPGSMLGGVLADFVKGPDADRSHHGV
jgi:acyl carrier protein phosphodiesterase